MTFLILAMLPFLRLLLLPIALRGSLCPITSHFSDTTYTAPSVITRPPRTHKVHHDNHDHDANHCLALLYANPRVYTPCFTGFHYNNDLPNEINATHTSVENTLPDDLHAFFPRFPIVFFVLAACYFLLLTLLCALWRDICFRHSYSQCRFLVSFPSVCQKTESCARACEVVLLCNSQ